MSGKTVLMAYVGIETMLCEAVIAHHIMAKSKIEIVFIEDDLKNETNERERGIIISRKPKPFVISSLRNDMVESVVVLDNKHPFDKFINGNKKRKW